MRILILLLCVAISSCASFGGADMSAEQLKALSSDKNFTAVCSTITGLGGQGKFVYTNVDRTVVVNGAITVAPDCSITMSNAPK